MNQRSLVVVFSLLLIAFLPSRAGAPRNDVTLSVSRGEVSIDYGRGRLHAADLAAAVPVGAVWEIGADRTTEIASAAELRIGTTVLPAGSYSLVARHTDDDEWELVFNQATGQFVGGHDPQLDLASMPLTHEVVAEEEALLIIELSPTDPPEGVQEALLLELRCGYDRLTAVLEIVGEE